MKTYELIIDHESCWGCRTCEVACKQENRAPAGVKRIDVWADGPEIVDGKPHMMFRIRVCRHCEDPACATVCPVAAITQRPDGIVVLDSDECTGCRACLDACPYGAIAFDERQNVAVKCNLCHHRIDRGLLPACAANVCLGHCIAFDGPNHKR